MLIVITKDGCHKMGENNPPSPSTIFLETSREVALEALLCRVGRQKRPSTGSLWKHFCVGTRKHTFREVALEALDEHLISEGGKNCAALDKQYIF